MLNFLLISFGVMVDSNTQNFIILHNIKGDFMITFSSELFFQIINTIFLIFIFVIGYKVFAILSNTLCKILRDDKFNLKK